MLLAEGERGVDSVGWWVGVAMFSRICAALR